MVLRHDLVQQLPSLKNQYLKYASYKGQRIEDIFAPEVLKRSLVLEAFTLATVALINDGKGGFRIVRLPMEAQFSPVYAITVLDMDGDRKNDILLGGNLYNVKPEAGPYDASYGTLLKGDGKGGFQTVPQRMTGIQLRGQARKFLWMDIGKENMLFVANNADTLQVFRHRSGVMSKAASTSESK